VNRSKSLRRYAFLAVAMIAAMPQSLFACAACFGKSDSALAKGMNWGIFSLLAVVVFVLGCFATFFIYLARRAAATAATNQTPPAMPETSSKPTLSDDKHIRILV